MNSKTYAEKHRRKLEVEKKTRMAVKDLSPQNIIVFMVLAVVVLVIYTMSLPYIIGI